MCFKVVKDVFIKLLMFLFSNQPSQETDLTLADITPDQARPN